MELLMHLEVYRQRPDVGAAIHAHPPITTAITVAGLSLSLPILPEIIATIGIIPTAPYATPSTPRCAEAIRELIREHDALVLDRHGTLTVGETPFDAYIKLEKIEHLAKITFVARLLGKVTTLPLEEVEKLFSLRKVNREKKTVFA
jgi:L-fuculose-phosphate aldolase